VNQELSGVLLLKTIILVSTIDSNAATSAICCVLALLDLYMPKSGYDITKFNHYVKSQMLVLTARGEQSQDLVTNLFKAYCTVKEAEFCTYIKNKESNHEDSLIQLNYETLLDLADNRYKILKAQGRWNAPSQEEEKIIALEAKLKQFETKRAPYKQRYQTDKKAYAPNKGNEKGKD
jgi:hypothetical protein